MRRILIAVLVGVMMSSVLSWQAGAAGPPPRIWDVKADNYFLRGGSPRAQRGIEGFDAFYQLRCQRSELRAPPRGDYEPPSCAAEIAVNPDKTRTNDPSNGEAGQNAHLGAVETVLSISTAL